VTIGGLVPALPSSVLEPLWVQVAALLPDRQVHHPLGCHRPRIPDRLVFDKLIQMLVFGCGYRRIADATCSASTLRRRRDEWISAGVAEQLRLAVLAAYDRLFGLSLDHLAVDSCTTKAPCGGQTAGPSPVDRRKQGLKRSTVTEAGGTLLGAVPAPANHHRRRAASGGAGHPHRGSVAARPASRAPGRRPRLPAVPAGPGRPGDGGPDRHPGHPGPDPGWSPLGDRAHPRLGNQYGKLRWCTERRRLVVEFWLALANAAIVLGRLVRRAWVSYRWEGRPRRRP
jgi:transposase